MNRSELSTFLANKHGFNKAFADRVLSTVLETVRDELTKGNRVRLRNFGSFEAKQSRGKLRAKFYGSKNFFQSLKLGD
jgi:nucleoid DNA-binding protein